MGEETRLYLNVTACKFIRENFEVTYQLGVCVCKMYWNSYIYRGKWKCTPKLVISAKERKVWRKLGWSFPFNCNLPHYLLSFFVFFLNFSLLVQLKPYKDLDVDDYIKEFAAKLSLIPSPPPGPLHLVITQAAVFDASFLSISL